MLTSSTMAQYTCCISVCRARRFHLGQSVAGSLFVGLWRQPCPSGASWHGEQHRHGLNRLLLLPLLQAAQPERASAVQPHLLLRSGQFETALCCQQSLPGPTPGHETAPAAALAETPLHLLPVQQATSLQTLATHSSNSTESLHVTTLDSQEVWFIVGMSMSDAGCTEMLYLIDKVHVVPIQSDRQELSTIAASFEIEGSLVRIMAQSG